MLTWRATTTPQTLLLRCVVTLYKRVYVVVERVLLQQLPVKNKTQIWDGPSGVPGKQHLSKVVLFTLIHGVIKLS